MTIRFVMIFILALIVMSCSNERAQLHRLQAKNDSLQAIIRTDKTMRTSMKEVSNLILSMRLNGLSRDNEFTPEETVTKMRGLRDYVLISRLKMDSLDKALKTHVFTNLQFSSAIRNLNEDLRTREDEILLMDEMMILSMNQNSNLIHVVGMQRLEIDDKLFRLRKRTRRLSVSSWGSGQIQTCHIQLKMRGHPCMQEHPSYPCSPFEPASSKFKLTDAAQCRLIKNRENSFV